MQVAAKRKFCEHCSKAIDELQRSSILPCASVYLFVIPKGSRGCGGGWQGGSAGLLMQPRSLRQDSGGHREGSQIGKERGEKK